MEPLGFIWECARKGGKNIHNLIIKNKDEIGKLVGDPKLATLLAVQPFELVTEQGTPMQHTTQSLSGEEEDILLYISGAILQKLNRKRPSLSAKLIDENPAPSTLIGIKTRGGLLTPIPPIVSFTVRLELIFRSLVSIRFHDFVTCVEESNVTYNLATFVPDDDIPDFVSFFLKTFFKIRANHHCRELISKYRAVKEKKEK